MLYLENTKIYFRNFYNHTMIYYNITLHLYSPFTVSVWPCPLLMCVKYTGFDLIRYDWLYYLIARQVKFTLPRHLFTHLGFLGESSGFILVMHTMFGQYSVCSVVFRWDSTIKWYSYPLLQARTILLWPEMCWKECWTQYKQNCLWDTTYDYHTCMFSFMWLSYEWICIWFSYGFHVWWCYICILAVVNRVLC